MKLHQRTVPLLSFILKYRDNSNRYLEAYNLIGGEVSGEVSGEVGGEVTSVKFLIYFFKSKNEQVREIGPRGTAFLNDLFRFLFCFAIAFLFEL